MYLKIHLLDMYRLYTEVKVSMGFIIPSDEVARLINAIETVPRYITDLYHEMVSHSNKNHAQTCYIKVVSTASSNVISQFSDAVV